MNIQEVQDVINELFALLEQKFANNQVAIIGLKLLNTVADALVVQILQNIQAKKANG